jgi:polar amino acid transport system substrate-binding protein
MYNRCMETGLQAFRIQYGGMNNCRSNPGSYGCREEREGQGAGQQTYKSSTGLERIMKGTGSVLFAIAFLLLPAAGCLSAPDGQVPQPAATTPQEIRPHYIIGVDGDFAPFTSQDRNGNFSGFDIEAARRVAEREGFDVQFVAVPWDNVIPALETGEIDIIWSGLTVTEERQARVNFSVPYYTVNQSIAVRAGSKFTMQDLYDGRLRIGAQAGSSEADWVMGNLVRTGKMSESNLSLYPDITTLTNSLEDGTVDASIIQFPSQQRAIKDKALIILGTTPSPDTYAVAVRKTDPELLAAVDHGLYMLMKDPIWQQLKEKYGLE